MILLQINVGCNSFGLFSSKTFALDSSLLPLSPEHVHVYLTLLGKNSNHTLPASSASLHPIPHFLCIISLLQLLHFLPLWRQKVCASLLREWRLTFHVSPSYLPSRLLHIHQLVPHSRTISLSLCHVYLVSLLKAILYLITLFPPYRSLPNLYIRLWLKEFWHTKANQREPIHN